MTLMRNQARKSILFLESGSRHVRGEASSAELHLELEDKLFAVGQLWQGSYGLYLAGRDTIRTAT